jgi:tetratricopeptide (TPR) repeat protein
MEDIPRELLCSLILEGGIEIIQDPKNFPNFLNDYYKGQYKKERKCLNDALLEEVPGTLLNKKDQLAYGVISHQLCQKLINNSGINPELAIWTVDTWAIALEIIKTVPERHTSSLKPSLVDQKSAKNIRVVSRIQSGFSDSNPLITRAIKLNQSKSFNEALDLLNQALQKEPENPVALREKAFAISNQGYYKDSLHWFNNSLRVNPNDPITWIQKGYALSKMGKNRDAIYCYDAAIRIDPDSAVVWRNRGFSLRKLKDYSAALQSYENALKINPQDPIAWKLKGGALGLMKRYHEAFQATKHALALDPYYDEAMMNMGWLLSDQERYQEAIEWYDKALQIDKNNPRAWKQRGYCVNKLNVQGGQKKPHPVIPQSSPKKAPMPENQKILEKIKGFFK